MNILSNIATIKLSDEFTVYKDSQGNRLSFLEELSKINILVGANNSGKSRIMRTLASLATYEYMLKNLDIKSINNGLIDDLEKIRHFIVEENKYVEFNNIGNERIEKLKAQVSALRFDTDAYIEVRNSFETWSIMKAMSSSSGGRGRSIDRGFFEYINSISKDALEKLSQIPKDVSSTPKRIYIPILRGLRPLSSDKKDYYAERTVSDYFSGNKNAPEIFTGLGLYRDLTSMLLGNNAERRKVQDYQKFISENLFEGRTVTLIPSQNLEVVVVKIGEEIEQPIYNLGDGIQSAIILSFFAHTIKDPSLFFIEEPEIHMHPGLQRKILSFFSKTNHMYFMTTHSNHLLDVTVDIKDISVFSFRKMLAESDDDEQYPEFIVEQLDRDHNSSLELLGVRNSSIFLVNATIWVEGITDRWYLRRMLNSYIEFLKKNDRVSYNIEEDVHYAFVEYGGANITHWSFLNEEEHPIDVDKLCARAIMIIDGDGDAKKERKRELEKVLGENLIILPCREIENTLPPYVIGEVIKDYEKDESVILNGLTYSAYKDAYLGRYIDTHVLRQPSKRKSGYQDSSGTIKDKRGFCERAIKHITYDTLPETTQKVIERIYNFIIRQNQ